MLGHRAKYLRSIYLLAGRRYTDSHYFYLVIHSPFFKIEFHLSNYTNSDENDDKINPPQNRIHIHISNYLSSSFRSLVLYKKDIL